MEDENVLNDTTSDLVSTQDNLDTDINQTEDVDTDTSEKQEVADTDKVEQTPEENAIYKKMRLKAQEEARKELEAEKLSIESEKQELSKLRQQRESKDAEDRILSQYLTGENIRNVAYENGVTEEVATKLIKLEAQSLIESEKQKVTQKFEAIQKQKQALKNDEFFNLIEKEVDGIVAQNPNVDFETAYHFLVGQKYKELQKKVSEKATQKTLADVQDRNRRKPVTGDSGSENTINATNVLSKRAITMAQVFGVDPNKVAKRVKEDEKNNRRR